MSDIFIAKVVSMGRVTIPSNLRKIYNIKVGTYVKLQLIHTTTKKGGRKQ